MEVFDVSPESIICEEETKPISLSKESISLAFVNGPDIHEITKSEVTSIEVLESELLPSVVVASEQSQVPSNEIQVLYSRAHRPIFVQNSEQITGDDDRVSRLKKAGRPPLTQIHEYRAFMEASTSLKTCLLELIYNIKNSIAILERKTSILRDPGFGGINILRCWIWIFEEALTLTRPTTKDKPAWKTQVAKVMKEIVSAYESIHENTERLEICYKKLELDFAKLAKKSRSKFHRNVNGSEELWNKADKDILKKDLDVERIDWITPTEVKPGRKVLKVRWTVDGITLRIDAKSQWLKFKSIKAFEDKKVLINIFTGGLKDPWVKVSKTLQETEKFMLSKKHASIEAVLKKLFRILQLDTKYVFVPKEEVMMLNTTLTNLRIFDAVQPLLDNLKKRTAKNLELVLELSSRQDDIILGKGKRVPLGKWSELMLELEVHSSVETILIRNAKKSANDELIDQEVGIQCHGQPAVEIICFQNHNFHDLSTPNPEPEETEYEVDSITANPTLESLLDTCYIFVDIRQEYEMALGSILSNRKFQESHLQLCSDNVNVVYNAVKQMERVITEANRRLVDAKEYILFNCSNPHVAMSTTTWVKIICRSLNIWDSRDLPLNLKAQFQRSCQGLLKKSEDLEESVKDLLLFMIKQKKQMERLHDYLMAISGFGVMSRIKFKQEILKRRPEESEEKGMNPYDEMVNLNFTDFNMEVSISSKSGSRKALSLNESPDQIKVQMMCNPFHHLTRMMIRPILNITRSTEMLEEHLDIKGIRECLIPSSNIFVPHFHKLETAIISSIMKGLEFKISGLIGNLQRLDSSVGNLSGMVQFVHLQIAEKKLISVSFDPLDKQDFKVFEELIEQMPDTIQIRDIIAKGEYKRLVERGIKDLERISEKKAEETLPIETVEEPKMPLYTKLTPELLKSGLLRDVYIKALVFWIKRFDKQMSENLTSSLSALISPKVSQTIVDGSRIISVGKLATSFGFVEGLSFLLRESIQSLKPQDLYSTRGDPITTIKSNLIKFGATIRRLEDVSRFISPILKKLTNSIASYKSKLPQDMSFLDNQVEELSKTPDLFNIILRIWKTSNDQPLVIDEYTQEMEIQWDSSNKFLILARSSTQPDPWVEFSLMKLSSQVNTINTMTDSACKAFNQAGDYLIEAQREVKKGKNLLKYMWNKLHDDEKSSVIPPSTVYVILKQFEYHINVATIIHSAISNVTVNTKAALATGMQHLQTLSSKSKAVLKRTRKYPDSLIIKVIIEAPFDIDTWLKVDNLIDENARGDHNTSIIEIKAAVEMKSSSSDNITTSSDEESGTKSLTKKLSFVKLSLSLLPKISAPKDDLLTLLQKTEIMVSSILRETSALLRSPDTSLVEQVKVDHFIGILILLVSSTLELQFFREASEIQVGEILNQCKELTNRIKNLGSSSVVDELHLNLTKIQRSADSMEKVLVQKFKQGGDASKIEFPHFVEDHEMLPEELAEHIAVKTSGYVWNTVCAADTGVVLKSQKSHESHGYMRLPLSKRIEIITSVMNYIDQILIITETNLQTVKKDLNSSKGMIKAQAKKVPLLLKKGIINDSNIVQTLDAVRSLKSTCDNTHTYLDQILEIIDNGTGIVKNIQSYLNLKFRLDTPNPDSTNRIMRDYRPAIQNKILELEISFAELQRYPISIEVPLSLSPIDFDYSESLI